MKIELVTAVEAYNLGVTKSRLLDEGHGAFGEAENSYEDVIFIGNKVERLSDNDLVLLEGEYPNIKAIQIISAYQSSDKLLEIMLPKELIKRKKEKYKRFVELKKEIDSDDFYKPKATSLEGCPFNYCDSNPKCEGKCRYNKQ